LNSVRVAEIVESHDVKNVFVHPDYDPVKLTNDIAVLQLKTASTVAPVRVDGFAAPALSDSQLATDRGRVLGWGRYSNKNLFAMSNFLKWGSVPVVPARQCTVPAEFTNTYGPVDDHKNTRICAAGTGKVDVCTGDSGGPLLRLNADKSYTQIGITSYTNAACNTAGIRSVFTRVSAITHIDFLRKYVGEPKPSVWAALHVGTSATRGGQTGPVRVTGGLAAGGPSASPANLQVWVDGSTPDPVTLIPYVVEATSAKTADFVWSTNGQTVKRRGVNTVAAEDIANVGVLSGVLEKWRMLPELEAMKTSKRISIRFSSAPTGGAFRSGDTMVPVVTRPSDPNLKYLTVFDLTSDGGIDYLYPIEGDGVGEFYDDPEIALDTKITCPYGIDHLVAIVTPTPPNRLRKDLQDMGKHDYPTAFTAVSVLQQELKGNYALEVVPLPIAR
jgi:hypothetical protein